MISAVGRKVVNVVASVAFRTAAIALCSRLQIQRVFDAPHIERYIGQDRVNTTGLESLGGELFGRKNNERAKSGEYDTALVD